MTAKEKIKSLFRTRDGKSPQLAYALCQHFWGELYKAIESEDLKAIAMIIDGRCDKLWFKAKANHLVKKAKGRLEWTAEHEKGYQIFKKMFAKRINK